MNIYSWYPDFLLSFIYTDSNAENHQKKFPQSKKSGIHIFKGIHNILRWHGKFIGRRHEGTKRKPLIVMILLYGVHITIDGI